MYMWQEEAWCLSSGVGLTEIPRAQSFSLYEGYEVNVPRSQGLTSHIGRIRACGGIFGRGVQVISLQGLMSSVYKKYCRTYSPTVGFKRICPLGFLFIRQVRLPSLQLARVTRQAGLCPVEVSTGHVGWWTRVHPKGSPTGFPKSRQVIKGFYPEESRVKFIRVDV